MPTLNIDISNAKQFTNLDLGEYEGEISALVFLPPREKGKFGQVQAKYLVTEGEAVGRTSSEFLPLHPNATFRLVGWMKKFGGEWEDMDPEELKSLTWETDEDGVTIIEPDLEGVKVVFKVFEETDRKTKEVRVKTELVEVLDDVDLETPVAGEAADDEDDEDDAPVEAEADEDDDEEPTPAPRRSVTKTAAKPAKVAKAARPARRSLR